MPEIPDLTVYVEALDRLTRGEVLERARVVGPFFLRTVEPPLSDCEGRRVLGVRRVGKRIVIALEGGFFLALHLMIMGRLKWAAKEPKLSPRAHLGAFAFSSGVLVVTEAGSKKRAALHVVRGEDGLAALDAGGIEPLVADDAAYAATLRRENHTLKRALTDPRLFAGIGNAYSDEILHRARMAPTKLTSTMTDEEVARLATSTRAVLVEWTDRIRSEAKGGFPEKVTAFRPGMAAHGRHGEPCPVCGAPIQRIVRAESESNYCAPCQTNGRLLADRALSKLLKDDWPRTVDELERRLGRK